MLAPLLAGPGWAQQMPGRPIWHDLLTPDLEISKAFYREMFGWTFRAPSMGKVHYIVAEMAGVAMGGLAEVPDGKGSGSQWLTYFEAIDVKGTVKRAVDSGGKIVAPATQTGSFKDETALVTDPLGATFGVKKPGFPPASGATPIHGWLWVELWTTDVDRSAQFYGTVLGFDRSTVNVGGSRYTAFEVDSARVGGVVKIPINGVQPNWLPTIRVLNVDSAVARAVRLGGRVVLAPRRDVRDGALAIIQDPTGAAIALQEWSGAITPEAEEHDE